MTGGEDRPAVVVAGATGFIGKALISSLKSHYRVIGLTRKPVAVKGFSNRDEVSWRQCDLFSLIDAEKGLRGADYAFYLVHSMLPSAHLTQGRFEDMDLILADNFARAAAMAGVKQIIYLGGLVPQERDNLSLHLQSRLEVEKTLGSHGVPVTALRAGLIIGTSGSTFRIMLRLVERLQLMVLPSQMLTQTHPIALPDVIKILCYCLNNKDTFNRSFDLGGPDVMTYRDMLIKIAEIMGYKRSVFIIPSFPARLAGSLLSLLTSSPRSLVTPLVESLKNPMVASDLCLQRQMGLTGMSFEKAVKLALSIKTLPSSSISPPAKMEKRKIALSVRSVQRLPLPCGKDADWVALHYSEWLPGFLKPFIRVDVDFWGCYFYLRFFRKSLLELTFSHNRSSKDRPLYYITGGLLARLNLLSHYGRLEFREVLENKYVLVAIHDYVPTLPWVIYNLTQARLHLWIMKNYSKYLESL